MITYTEGKNRFNYRVVGILIHNNKVLLHKVETDDFWSMPGGRVELIESSENALKREMAEELSINVTIDRLIWVVENFFNYENMDYYELSLFYLMNTPANCDLLKKKTFFGDEEGIKLIFKWFDISELGKIRLFPTFLRKSLKSIPETIQHIIHTDIDDTD